VAARVPGQKRHAQARQGTDKQRVAWVAERRANPALFHVSKSFHLVKAAAADDANTNPFSH
jgi:hypothetical protein